MAHPTLDFKRSYLAMRRALEGTLKRFNFTGAQFDVVQVLLHEGPLEHRDLQRRLAIASPTLSNIIDGMEREGQVTRRVDTADARVKTIHLSSKARHLCSSDEFCAAGDALVAKMFAGFTATERRAFTSYLARIEANLDGA